VGFTALGFHGVGQTEIQNAFAGGVNDELTALVAEGFPLGPDHHKLATSRRPPSDEPFFVVSKPVLGEMVLSWGDENQRKYGFILPITLCCFTSIWQAIKHHHVRVRNG
jgi:hypothetical protein